MMIRRKPKSVSPRRNRLRLEKLCARNLFAGDVLVFENFQDGSVDGFDPVYSSAASHGIEEALPGEFVYQSIFETNETQTAIGREIGVVDSVELSFRVRLPDGVSRQPVAAHDFVAVKLSRLVAPEGAPPLHNLQNELQVYRNGDGSSYAEILFYAEQNNTADRVSVELDPNEWIDIRYQVFFNTPGQSDGSLTVWINGNEEIHREGMVWAPSASDRPGGLWVGGPITMRGVDPASAMRRQLDDIQIRTNLNSDPEPEDPAGDIHDVNNDGRITALDALILINAINDLEHGGEWDQRLDVNQDGRLSSVDALQVINHLYEQLDDDSDPPELVEYTTFQGASVSLYAYEGEHVRILAQSPDLNQQNIEGLIREIDQGYEFYRNVTGRDPFDHGQSVGKTTIAQVNQTCGAGCGFLGVRGIEIASDFFDQAVEEYSRTGKPDHIFYYEMGRNFWFYQSKLEFNQFRSDLSSRGSGDFIVNGFPILMERAFSEFLDVPLSGPAGGAGTMAYRNSMARWLDSYVNDPTMNFVTVFLDFENSLHNDPSTAGGNVGTMDFFAEVMLDVARDYGEIEFLQRFWTEIAQRPDMTDLDSAISNLVDSASIAAGEDLHGRFINKYKWNSINYERRLDDFDWEGREAFGGGGLSAIYKPGSPYSEYAIQIVETRVDEAIDFEWGLANPFDSLPTDHFSIDWTGQIFFPKAEEYLFKLFADDGVRLWIDGELVIEGWQPQRQELTGTFTVSESGPKSIRLQYFEKEGAATVRLGWQSSLFDGVVPTNYLSTEGYTDHRTSPTASNVAVFRDGVWFLDEGDGGLAERTVEFGLPGDTPLTGDYNGDGDQDLVVVRENFRTGLLDWYYDYSADGNVDASLQFGLLGDQPVSGDFNGDGLDDAAVVRDNPQSGGLDWYIDYDRTGFAAEEIQRFGNLGDQVAPGDFNGDGRTEFAVARRENGLLRWYLDLANDGIFAESTSLFGLAADRVIVGDWDANGDDDFGVVRTSLNPDNVDVLFDLNDGADLHQEGEIRYGSPGDDFLSV